MKKYLVLLFMSVTTMSYAGYYYDGGAMGFCDYVNRTNPSVVTAAGFWEYPVANTNDTTLIRAYDSQTYAFRTLVIGYPLSDNSLVKFDGDFLKSDPSYIICNTSRYLDPSATNVVGYGLGSFYGGRSKEWLIPKKWLRPGENKILVDIPGYSGTITINVK